MLAESDDNEERDDYYKMEMTESKEPLLLNVQQKKDAKTRAHKRLIDIEKQVIVARSNYWQFCGFIFLVIFTILFGGVLNKFLQYNNLIEMHIEFPNIQKKS